MSSRDNCDTPHRDGWFRAFAERTATTLGRPRAFLIALTAVVLWLATGPVMHFSDAWQAILSLGTSVITFLMIFVLQSTQTRDSHAIHLKLNELLRAVADARTTMVGVEALPDAEIQALRDEFSELSREAPDVPPG
jgi:low affinity Fe/Cu permease